jgi:hypothetical protein
MLNPVLNISGSITTWGPESAAIFWVNCCRLASLFSQCRAACRSENLSADMVQRKAEILYSKGNQETAGHLPLNFFALMYYFIKCLNLEVDSLNSIL